MSDTDYHRLELEIARSPSDPRHIMPPVLPGIRRVLDIGCGAGQTLIVADMGSARKVGVDVDFAALRLGKQLSSDIDLVLAAGEALPFRGATYDLVISRVALPYMHIPTAIREAARVLVRDGRVWFVLHPVSRLSWKSTLGSPRRILVQAYVALNSLLFADPLPPEACKDRIRADARRHDEMLESGGICRHRIPIRFPIRGDGQKKLRQSYLRNICSAQATDCRYSSGRTSCESSRLRESFPSAPQSANS
jgi:SAM-dependent methyltransferase